MAIRKGQVQLVTEKLPQSLMAFRADSSVGLCFRGFAAEIGTLSLKFMACLPTQDTECIRARKKNCFGILQKKWKTWKRSRKVRGNLPHKLSGNLKGPCFRSIASRRGKRDSLELRSFIFLQGSSYDQIHGLG